MYVWTGAAIFSRRESLMSLRTGVGKVRQGGERRERAIWRGGEKGREEGKRLNGEKGEMRGKKIDTSGKMKGKREESK